MTHKDVLVHVLQVDNVSVGTSTPMEVQLTTRLGHISENLIGRTEINETDYILCNNRVCRPLHIKPQEAL